MGLTYAQSVSPTVSVYITDPYTVAYVLLSVNTLPLTGGHYPIWKDDVHLRCTPGIIQQVITWWMTFTGITHPGKVAWHCMVPPFLNYQLHAINATNKNKMSNVALPEYTYVEYVILAWLVYASSECIVWKVVGILYDITTRSIFWGIRSKVT